MKLDRPLVFFDVESTGVDPAKDKIVTFSALKVYPLSPPNHILNAEFNPGVSMSEDVIAIHGITNEQAAKWPPFETHAKAIQFYLANCDLAGFNLLNFDIPILWEEFWRVGIEWSLDGVNIIDVGNIFKIQERRTLAAAMKFYCGVDHSEAHDAKADTMATKLVLDAQVKRYPELAEFDVPKLAEFSKMNDRVDLAGKIIKDKDGDPSYAFGKCKGMKVRDDQSYAQWMLKSDFSEQTKITLRKILKEIEEWK